MKRFGVFAWSDTGCYRPAQAVKVYAAEHAANKLAQRMTEQMGDDRFVKGGYVVRSFHVNDEGASRPGDLAW